MSKKRDELDVPIEFKKDQPKATKHTPKTRLRKDGQPWGSPRKEAPKKMLSPNNGESFKGLAKKGEVRNPYGFYGKAGREGTLRMINYARSYTKLAVDTLVEIAKDKKALDGSRVSAATEILNRGHGKAKESIELTGADGGPVEFKQYEKGKEDIMMKLFGETYAIRKQEQAEDDIPPTNPEEEESDNDE